MIFSIAPLHSCVQSTPCFADFSGASSQCCLFLSYQLLCCSLILSSLSQSCDLQDGISQCWLRSPNVLFAVLSRCWDPHQEMCAEEGRTWEEGAVSPLALALHATLFLQTRPFLPPSPVLILSPSDGNRTAVWDEERAMGDSYWFSSPTGTTGVGIHLKELSLRLQCQCMSGGLSLAGSGCPPSCLLAVLPQQDRGRKTRRKSSWVKVQGAHLTVNKTDLSWGK